MNSKEKPIGRENAQTAAERFILDRYPYSKVNFEAAEFKTDGIREVYEVIGYCRLIKWFNSVGRKIPCKIQVDAYSADIIGYQGMEHMLSS